VCSSDLKTFEEGGAASTLPSIEVASGDQTKSEYYGFGDDEFVPWQIGAVM